MTKKQSYEIRSLSRSFCAEITGLDLSKTIHGDIIAEIMDDILRYQVIIFREQKLSPNQEIAFAKLFGSLEISPMHMSDYPEIIPISNFPEYGYPLIGYDWHTDGAHRIKPPSLTFYYALQVPQIGGITIFSNAYAAYEVLSDDIKQKLQTMKTVYVNGVTHPLVITHPITKRKSLYINGPMNRFLGISGMSQEETRTFLGFLISQLERPEFTYDHKYAIGDLAIWDNACVAHKPTYTDPKLKRIMHRITVVGTVSY